VMDYIQLQRTFEGQDSNPTLQQRAVYNFYQARNSDEADDIYSNEWLQRTKSYLEIYSQPNAAPIALKTWQLIEDVDFGAFYLTHPIAGYSLWNMLEACYELDRIVCGNSKKDMEMLLKWKKMKPFVYLRSKKIGEKWTASLLLLKAQIEDGTLEGAALVSRLLDLLRGVERLESALAAIDENFADNLLGLKFVDRILTLISRAVDDRRQMISELLRLGKGKHKSNGESNTAMMGYSEKGFDAVSNSRIESSTPTSSDNKKIKMKQHAAAQTDGTSILGRLLSTELTCFSGTATRSQVTRSRSVFEKFLLCLLALWIIISMWSYCAQRDG
jgi:hypothetical protein